MKRTEVNIILQNSVESLSPASPRAAVNMNHSHIPVPKISSSSKLHERFPPVRRDSMDRNTAKTLSVAAQRAAFEKLDATANQHKSTMHKLTSNANISLVESNRNGESKFPLPKKFDNHSLLNRSNSFSENKWKSKYEDSEKRRKMALIKSENVMKEIAELDKKYQMVHNENKKLHLDLQEREQELQKLQTVSEAVCKEYEQLKHKYDIETGAMHKAMQQASQWYKQNRQLKRRSQVITQKMLLQNPDILPDLDLTDDVDSNDDDAEQLRETVRELSEEVAKLQTELNAARLQEFEAQEQVTLLTAQLEEERAARKIDNEKLRELMVHKESVQRVSKLVTEEVQTLKEQCDRERENARIIKMEADRAQKERNVFAHQSALLMAEVGEDPNGRVISLLQEIEKLKRTYEEEQQHYTMQIQLLQEQLEDKESNVEFEIVEEKLKLAESELEMVVERAERAEKDVENLKLKIAELERKNSSQVSLASLSIPPPPPPPLPPFLPALNNAQSSVKLITREKKTSEIHSAVSDMEKMLGMTKKAHTISPQPAIDDIINQIKGGRFTLKHTDKQKEEERRRREVAENTPPAVSEMLNILGTMRRRAKSSRQSINSISDTIS